MLDIYKDPPKEKNEATRLFEKIWDEANDPMEIKRKQLKKDEKLIQEDKSFYIE